MTIATERARGKVTFLYYADKELWYITECGFKFPVLINYTGTATFNAQDDGILFMRWIRKHSEYLEEARNE